MVSRRSGASTFPRCQGGALAPRWWWWCPVKCRCVGAPHPLTSGDATVRPTAGGPHVRTSAILIKQRRPERRTRSPGWMSLLLPHVQLRPEALGSWEEEAEFSSSNAKINKGQSRPGFFIKSSAVCSRRCCRVLVSFPSPPPPSSDHLPAGSRHHYRHSPRRPLSPPSPDPPSVGRSVCASVSEPPRASQSEPCPEKTHLPYRHPV